MAEAENSRKRDDRGLTLIEMVIAIALIGIFTTVVATFITSGANLYRKVSATATLQSEMQTTVESIQNYLLDTNIRITYTAGGQETRNDLDSDGAVDRQLELYFSDERKGIQTGLIDLTFNSEENRLYYHWWGHGSTSVLAEHVKNFTVDLSEAKEKGEVRFRLTLADGGKELSQLCTVTLRNQLEQ